MIDVTLTCAHQFLRVQGWWCRRKTDRYRCRSCGYVTRHYDSVDALALRPVHEHMSVAVLGFNAKRWSR